VAKGFDFGIAGTATAMPAFQRVMGRPWPSEASGYLIPATIQSAWTACSTAGEILGVLVSGHIMDRIGRKHTILIGSLFTAIGVAMQVASHEWKLFLGGRLVNGVGFGIVYVIAPVWIGENVRPELRGLFLCIMNGSIVFAQFVLALIAYGTDKLQGTWSYQTLVVLQFAFVAALLLGYPFFPESPYLLLKKCQEERARKSLTRIHGSKDQALIDAELSRMKESIEVSAGLEAVAGMDGPPIIQVWKKSNLVCLPPRLMNTKRTLISLLPPMAQQFIGAAFVITYVTYFLSLLGVKDYFTVSVALYVIMLVSNLSAFPLIEVAGRRPLLLYGMIALTVIELIMGIMGCISSSAALWVILVCIFLWALVYQVSIGAVGFALASEVASPPLRPVTLSLVGITQGLSGWIIGFVTPYMINPDAGNLGAKVGFVFAGLGIPLCITFYFAIPETLGLSFADMDYLFAEKVSPRHFQKAISEHRRLIDHLELVDQDSKAHEATVIHLN
ncbi:general substrate transporter, partial [Cryphonectria parasitica EP155]